MSPQLISQLATGQARDLQRLRERHGNRPRHRERAPVNVRHHRSSLRRRMGLTLVEAGLQLLASTAD